MTDKRTTGWSANVESVYQRHGQAVWAIFYARTCDADLAYDALQEAFTRLQQQSGSEIANERAWLIRVGGNWLRDAARRNHKAPRPSESLDTLAGSIPEPETVAHRNELQHQVRNALGQLPLGDREVLVLRYALDWSSVRIGATLDVTPSAVDARLSRARRRLARLLDTAGVDHELV